jgi:hypothetical protein
VWIRQEVQTVSRALDLNSAASKHKKGPRKSIEGRFFIWCYLAKGLASDTVPELFDLGKEARGFGMVVVA